MSIASRYTRFLDKATDAAGYTTGALVASMVILPTFFLVGDVFIWCKEALTCHHSEQESQNHEHQEVDDAQEFEQSQESI